MWFFFEAVLRDLVFSFATFHSIVHIFLSAFFRIECSDVYIGFDVLLSCPPCFFFFGRNGLRRDRPTVLRFRDCDSVLMFGHLAVTHL